MPKTWQQITRNTYRRQLEQMSPPAVASDGMGYGQSYLTQASLLMDDMKGASKNIYWLSGFCFSPRQEYPYRVPEGITMKRNGSKWRRWGDLGNLYQLAEVVYTIHVMLGIDDLNEDTLLLMPRLTDGIEGLEIADWPVRNRLGSRSGLIPISVSIKRNVSKQTFSAGVHSAEAISHCRFRVGPFPLRVKKLNLVINGKQEIKELQIIGDSKWAWIDFGNGVEKNYSIAANAY